MSESPVEQEGHIGINCTEHSPEEYGIAHRERLLRYMGEDHPSNLMGELQAPRTKKWHEKRRIDDPRLRVRGCAEPEKLDNHYCREWEQLAKGAERAQLGREPSLEHVHIAMHCVRGPEWNQRTAQFKDTL